jgi:hypothetical protein
LKKTSDFLNKKSDGNKKDKDKKAAAVADPSKRETLAAVPAREPKRMSGEFRMTKVDFGADGKEQQLTVSASDGGAETPSGLTPSSSAASIADHANHSDKEAPQSVSSTAAPTPSGPSLTADGSIAKADVDLVDAMLNEVKTEMEPAAALPVVGNTTSTEEDEDDFASRQQMIEARRTNRSFTTIAKPVGLATNPRRAKDDSAAPSSLGTRRSTLCVDIFSIVPMR